MSTSKSRKQATVGNLIDQATITLDNAAQPDDRNVSPNPGTLIEDRQMSPSHPKRSARGKENKVTKPVKRGKRTTPSAKARSAKTTASRRPSATKAETIITLLKRSHGASIAEMMKATIGKPTACGDFCRRRSSEGWASGSPVSGPMARIEVTGSSETGTGR